MMMLPSLSSRPLVSLFVLVAVGQRLHDRTAAHAYECTINVINNSYMKLKLQTYNGGDKVCWVKYASFELPASQIDYPLFRGDIGCNGSDGCLVKYGGSPSSIGCPPFKVPCNHTVKYMYSYWDGYMEACYYDVNGKEICDERRPTVRQRQLRGDAPPPPSGTVLDHSMIQESQQQD